MRIWRLRESSLRSSVCEVETKERFLCTLVQWVAKPVLSAALLWGICTVPSFPFIPQKGSPSAMPVLGRDGEALDTPLKLAPRLPVFCFSHCHSQPLPW